MLKNSSFDWYRKMGRVKFGRTHILGGPVFGGYVRLKFGSMMGLLRLGANALYLSWRDLMVLFVRQAVNLNLHAGEQANTIRYICQFDYRRPFHGLGS
jgi:hypothetical protein